MVRKTLLSLTLIGVIVMPDIGSAQAGNYDLTGVHNIYHYLVREMDNSVGDSLDGSYEVKAHWPNAYNSLFGSFKKYILHFYIVLSCFVYSPELLSPSGEFCLLPQLLSLL